MGICCAMTGRYIAHKLSCRVRLLEKAEMMISIICSEISYVALPSDQIIALLLRKNELSDLTFLISCNEYLKDGEDFPVAWDKSLKGRNFKLFLNRKDIDLLIDFGRGFGITDCEGQISLCRLYIDMLRIKRDEAIKEKEQYAAPAAALGFLLGIALIVIIL